MKKLLPFLTVILLCFASAAKPIKIGLVLDRGGRDDKSFNSAAFAGATRAEKELGIELKTVEATDLNSIQNLHRSLASRDFDLIIGIGFAQRDAVQKMSEQFPNKKFALVDGEVLAKNVRSLLFEEHEGSFLVGVLAALHSKSPKMGFIGGMDIPLIQKFEAGYRAGVIYQNPKAEVITQFVGVSGEAWNNPTKAKELALSQYNRGVDVIFAAAGASGGGVFDAAEEKKKFAIGVDSNQNWMRPGRILTSMVKRVDVAVFEAIQQVKNGKFESGVVRYGLKNLGVDYSLDEFNQTLITDKMKARVEEVKKKIISGQIKVPQSRP